MIVRLRKALGEMYPDADLFLAPTPFQLLRSCGDVDHGHSAQEGVINTVLYGMLASRVVRTNSKHSVPSHACAGAIPYSEIRQAEIFTRPREIRSEDEGRQAEIHRTVRNSEAVILLLSLIHI